MSLSDQSTSDPKVPAPASPAGNRGESPVATAPNTPLIRKPWPLKWILFIILGYALLQTLFTLLTH